MLRAIALLLGALLGASALYEDQAGELDWYRQNVGAVLHADFHTAQGRRLVFVSTDVGMVAALDATTGETAWRQPLPAGERIVAQAIAPGAGALLVGSLAPDGALMARRWTLDGDLVWDVAVLPPAPDAPSPAALAFVGDGAESVVALWGASVTLVRGHTGERAWAWTHEAGEVSASWGGVHLTADRSTLVVYGRAGAGRSSALARAELAFASGAPASEVQLARAPSALDEADAAVLTLEPRFVVTLDAARTHLVFQADGDDGAHGGGAVRTSTMGAWSHASAGAHARILRVPLPGAVLVRLGEGHVVLVDLTTGEPHVRWEARAAGPVAIGSLRAGAQAIVAAVYAGAPAASLEQSTVLVTAGGAEVLPSPSAVPLTRGSYGAPSALYLGSYSKKDGGGVVQIAQRALLVTADGAVHGLADARALWAREEALARPEQLEFLAPPRARETEALADGPQYGQLLRAATRALGVAGGAGARPDGASGGGGALFADSFGFRKLVVVRTASSKVLALRADDGGVAWSALPSLDGQPVETLTMVVVPAPITHLDTDLLLVVRTLSQPHTYAALTYDGLTGELRAPAHSLPSRVLWSAPVPASDAALAALEAGARAPAVGHALVLDDFTVALLPDTDATARAFEAARTSIFFYLLDGAAGVIRGYGFARSQKQHGFRAVVRWTYILPANAHDLSIAQLDSAEAVHAPVQVLGDRGVLHKHLNKNLVALGYTQLDRAAPAAGPSVHVTVLDGVTGAAVHDFVQPRAAGPVKLALTENVVVAHSSAVPSGKPMLSLIELYDNATEPDYLAIMFSGSDAAALRARSSFEPRAPFALSTSFFVSAEVEAMAFTQTAKGITPRQLMLALHSGQMLALDKKLLDTRRPIGAPSTADREEGLMPYSPVLGPMPLQLYVTHGHRVERARGVRCAATTLESTSIVALYGADLFISRQSPAKNFDMLAPDFNKGALALAVAALGVGTVVTTHLRRRQELNRLWR